MIVHPETYADRGCWISDDRVFAFVSSAAHGITEIGYHGAQPSSKNARVFVKQAGALRFAVSTAEGIRQQLKFDDFDWAPDSMMMHASSPIGNAQVQVNMTGREIRIGVTDVSGEITSFIVQMDKTSLFRDVHGLRTWNVRFEKEGWAEFVLHDEVVLKEWMKREGPYGTDFLIPEPLRRKIYRRRIRSGLASQEDLLPEYQDSFLQIYSAEVQIWVGGGEYCTSEDGDFFLFTSTGAGKGSAFPSFLIRFDSGPGIQVAVPSAVREGQRTRFAGRHTSIAVPTITIPGFDHTERFFSTVPGLVDSCMIRDLGIARSTPGGYYWIWAWDALVTALASLRWGGLEIAEGTAAFVDGHRDEGRIPMRWTHELEALDTQPHGALDALLASLVYASSRERQPASVSLESYKRMLEHFKVLSEASDRRGLSSNIGFYPDLPLRFGRTEESTVAMEAAAFYTFCRVFENCALQIGDMETAHAADKMSLTLEHSFCEVFWDKRRKFFIDSVDRQSGLRNTSYPVFSLLFLHHPPGLQLIRSCVQQSADFIARHLLTAVGMRLLPKWDRNAGSETVSGSWYPYWDAGAVKLLRKGGRSAELVTWLGSVELALQRLGYAPEYLVLHPSLLTDFSAWHHHGAASNLNCATGWYQALLEGILGLEFDPGGLTIMPLALPLHGTAAKGICHLGTRWDVKATGAGPHLRELRVDGQEHSGCLKIPLRYHDGGRHEVEQIYGGELAGPHFLELANAEVLDVSSSSRGIEVALNALGRVDLVFSAPDDWLLHLDGRHVSAPKLEYGGPRVASVSLAGKHTVLLSRRGSRS